MCVRKIADARSVHFAQLLVGLHEHGNLPSITDVAICRMTAQYGVRHKVLVFSKSFYQQETARVTGNDGYILTWAYFSRLSCTGSQDICLLNSD